MMTWKFLSAVTLGAVLAFGAARFETAANAQQSIAPAPLNAPRQAGCASTRMQIPTGSGLEWKQLFVCQTE